MIDLSLVTPVYEVMQGWMSPTSEIRRFEDLPVNAQAYVNRISALIETPMKMISVGPERSQTIIVE